MGREKIKVMLFDLEGNFLQEYDSLTELCDAIKVHQPQVTACINGQSLSCGGFQVRKKFPTRNIYKIGDITGVRANTFMVGKYWNDRLISTYSSILEASVKNDVEAGNISNAITSGWKVNGFTYKKLNA